MRLVRYLQHWLGGTGPHLQVTDFVPDAHESMENLGIMPRRASPRLPWRVSYAWRGSFGFERCVNDEGPATEAR